jgi:hypothetical protein
MKWIVAALFGAVLRGQEPAGVIEVALRDATTHAPLDQARVTLRGSVSRSATTGAGGGFRFEQLPAGDYELNVQKSGYLDSVRRTVALKAGAVSQAVAIELTPLGAIEGKVLDEGGKPLAGVSVNLAGASQVSDREGSFVFEGVAPGSYQIAIGVPHAVRTRNLVRDEGSGDYYGYAPAQYYPGADDPRLAIPVSIAPGVRLRNFELRLRRTLLVEFTGRLMDMAGREPISNAAVQLTSVVDGPRDPLWRRATLADGSFRFSLIQPGAYTLEVFRSDLTPLPYVVPLEIGKAGAEDQPVSIPPFPRLRGDIQRDPKLQWTGSAAVRIVHRSGVSITSEMRSDGSFEFESVPPGDYTFDVQTRNLRARGDGARRFSAGAIRFGGQNALHRTVTVAESGNPPLEVQLTDEPAGISGSVVEDGATTGARYVVSVATVPQRRGFAPLAVATPGFQFPDLGPGDYDVTARRGNISSGMADLNKSCDETRRVTVREGAVTTITLHPCP